MNHVRPLTEAELDALRVDMEEASRWICAELQRRWPLWANTRPSTLSPRCVFPSRSASTATED